MSTLDQYFDNDYNEYIIYTENRTSISSSGFKKEIKELYELLYIFSSVIFLYKDLDINSKIWNFISETKNDLIICFDLLNMNYHTASKKILRSSIESFLRFSLCVARYYEYKDNKANNIFRATDSLKQLKAMVDTHKVGKMTFFTQNYFSNTGISKNYLSLINKYRDLSGNVHVNSNEIFTPHRFLSSYSTVDIDEVTSNINEQKEVLINILLCLYYFDLMLKKESFSKYFLLKLEHIGGETVKERFDDFRKI
ncbi:PE PGRS family protein [Listeria floridensis FSL S10-1187]|uniref:PE PGRS family protein n=1 Tax=Listeria floridensis FSL S10-1187 TaxID=1265817 RepID=A0ABP3AUT7_9LIST|nr:hypothetical protein [Listeria floridensis]EUJ26925.1 PE PGRS family protein [Listeria floridensis FSL S10-1187]